MEDGQLSDEFLIEAIAGEAMWALERLYRRYRGRFYAMAYRMTSDHMVAEELVQDAFFAIWQHSRSYDPAAGTVSTWLFSIIYHGTIDYLRDVRRRSARTHGRCLCASLLCFAQELARPTQDRRNRKTSPAAQVVLPY
ncbi:MAG: RNA polymerase sigma factor [Ktedonobacteraceae bacterium]